MFIKVAFKKEIHLFKGERQLEGLKKHCKKVFKAIPSQF